MFHSTTYKHKRVLVIMKDGTKFIDKFMDKKNRYLFFEVNKKVIKADIRAMIIVRK